jgi:hypothetical protein
MGLGARIAGGLAAVDVATVDLGPHRDIALRPAVFVEAILPPAFELIDRLLEAIAQSAPPQNAHDEIASWTFDKTDSIRLLGGIQQG